MSFLAYHRAVWSRGWRDTVTFVKAHVLGGLVIAVVTAVVTGWASADIGEAFNVHVAIYGAVAAAGFVAFWILWWNMMAAPWRLYEEQAARLRVFEQRPDVTTLVQLRERGVDLRNEPLKRPMRDEEQLSAWQAKLRAWEDETATELWKCASKIEASAFRILDTYPPRALPGVTNQQNAEMAMLTERLDRLIAIVRRVEGD